MAIIRAFKAIRPNVNFAKQVAALPYDVMNSNEARIMVENNKYSFLHIDKAEVDLDENINIYDKVVYEKAKENLDKMVNDKIFIKDSNPCMYIYRLIMNGRAQTGLVVCTSIDDYLNDVIKKHEHTRAEKELDRINHVDYCNANTGPIFLTYKYEKHIENIIKTWSDKEPIYNFIAEDGVGHIVWKIDDLKVINELIYLFNNVESLYIADGHHRAASAVKVGLKRREENKNFTGNEEFNYFLSVLFQDKDLYVMDYNRVVKDLNNLTQHQFIEKIKEEFYVELLNDNVPFKPNKKGEFGMYINNNWYKLMLKEGTYNNEDPVNGLDVAILQNNLLEPILNIDDPRKSNRIDFVGGIRGLKYLEERVDSGEAVAFSMYPVSTKELMDIADKGMVMPPKSTWFEPKLRSGLFIHELE